MLTFLRRIRKGLLNGNRTSRYLLYAIGEIALVVIGILIALQINNWNEKRKRNNLEVETLKEIGLSLESNLDYIEAAVNDLRQDANKIKSLVDHLLFRKPYADSLEELFYYPYRGMQIIVNQSAYKMLENRGIDIISNKALRTKIVEHYNFQFTTMAAFGHSEMTALLEFRRYYQTLMVPKYDDLFIGHTERKYSRMVPFDYERLLNDVTFINQLKWRISRIEIVADRLGNGLVAETTRSLKTEISKWLENSGADRD